MTDRRRLWQEVRRQFVPELEARLPEAAGALENGSRRQSAARATNLASSLVHDRCRLAPFGWRPSCGGRCLSKAVAPSARRSGTSGRLRPNDKINVAVENLQQRRHLVDGLAVIRLIE